MSDSACMRQLRITSSLSVTRSELRLVHGARFIRHLTPLFIYGYYTFRPCFREITHMARNDLLGSLGFLVLKTLSQAGSLHGYGIVLHIQRASDELLRVEEGSLYPALHRMEQSGWISSEWALTETNRKAKYYKLTAAGKKELQEVEKSFDQLVKGVRAMLRYA
jgi:PadR family transcriptional regulator PadR